MTRVKPSRPVAQRAGKPVKNKVHLAHVATNPCCICCRFPVQVHHLLKPATGKRGASRKAGDNETIGLCLYCHQTLHDRFGDEDEFFRYYTGDKDFGRKRAERLWRMSPGRENG